MARRRLTDEEIARANSASIMDYIYGANLETKKAGKTLKIEGYGGLYIDPVGNRWNCFSQGVGGGPIQFVMFMENKSWVEAVKTILHKTQSDQIRPVSRPTRPAQSDVKEFNLPKKNTTYKHVFAYLIQNRCIDKDIVYEFIKNKTLYEDQRKNCVFVGHDSQGKARYAGLRGTNTYIPFKGEAANSDKAFSFYRKGESNRLYVFESPIELMSYLSIVKKYDSEKNFGHHMLSLGGVTTPALDRYLKEHPNIKEITLCLNNDEPGLRATKEIREKYKDKYEVSIQIPKLKDYNDMLTFYHRQKASKGNHNKLPKPKFEDEDEWDMEI